eukprot:m.1309617 g.1309617  ORF g.1309617 m.1309617 type:complete len:78 (+) comp24824_c0_seq28:1867-2100(+)
MTMAVGVAGPPPPRAAVASTSVMWGPRIVYIAFAGVDVSRDYRFTLSRASTMRHNGSMRAVGSESCKHVYLPESASV